MGIYSGVRWQQIDQCGKADSTKLPLGCWNWWSFIVGFATLLAARYPPIIYIHTYIYIYIWDQIYIYIYIICNIYIYIYIYIKYFRKGNPGSGIIGSALLDLHSGFLGAVRGITPLLTSLPATVNLEAHRPIGSWWGPWSTMRIYPEIVAFGNLYSYWDSPCSTINSWIIYKFGICLYYVQPRQYVPSGKLT